MQQEGRDWGDWPGLGLSAIIADGDGGIIAGLDDGTAWKISTDLQAQQLPLRPNRKENNEEQPMAGKGRPFQKGVSGNPGGRPKVLGDAQAPAF